MRKRISFILPSAGVSGGVKVVYQHANFLRAAGHDVAIYYPGVLNPSDGWQWSWERRLRAAKYQVERLLGRNEAREWFPLQVPLHHIPAIESRFIRRGHLVIATGALTAAAVAKLPAKHGKKVYFVQDIESWEMPEAEALATWKLPFEIITISSTLKRKADELGIKVRAVVPNGIDPAVFFNEKPAPNVPPRLLMMSHKDERKGLPDGIAAIRAVKQQHPEVSFSMFGAYEPRSDMPHDTQYFHRPDQYALQKIYSSHDIFISPSHAEGCQLPPMEAMACGCAVVATNVGGIPDYAIAGKTALVVEPKQPGELASAIQRLIEQPKLRAQLARAGQQHIRENFTLEKASQKFLDALMKL